VALGHVEVVEERNQRHVADGGGHGQPRGALAAAGGVQHHQRQGQAGEVDGHGAAVLGVRRVLPHHHQAEDGEQPDEQHAHPSHAVLALHGEVGGVAIAAPDAAGGLEDGACEMRHAEGRGGKPRTDPGTAKVMQAGAGRPCGAGWG
jgi:hypothetical protein